MFIMTDNNYYKYQLIFFYKINSMDLFKSYYTYKILYHEIINEINHYSSDFLLNDLTLLDMFIAQFSNLKNISQNIYIFFKILHIILDINNNIQISLNNDKIKDTLKNSLSENSNKSIEHSNYLSEITEHKESYSNLYNKLTEINELYQKLYSLSTKYEKYNYNINIIYENLKSKDINEFINIPFNLKPTKQYLKNKDTTQNILIVFNIIKESIKNILDIKQLKIDLKDFYNYTCQIFDKYLSYLNIIKDTIQIPDFIKNNIINDINNINIKRYIWLTRINKYYEVIYNSIINKLQESNNNFVKSHSNNKPLINKENNYIYNQKEQLINNSINQSQFSNQIQNKINSEINNNINNQSEQKKLDSKQELIKNNSINLENEHEINQYSNQTDLLNNSLNKSSNSLQKDQQKENNHKKEINKKDFSLKTVIEPIKLFK